MKFTVEIDSTYLRNDNLDDAIAEKIQKEVIRQVWDKVEDAVEEQVQKVAKAHVKERLDDKIREYAGAFIESEKVDAPRRSDFDADRITLDQYILYMFDKDSKSDKIKSVVKKKAEQYAESIKDRYDTTFAQQVILKMRDQQLLKPDVELALFESKMKDGDKDAN